MKSPYYDIDIDIDRVNQPADRASRVDIFSERNGNDRNLKVDLLVAQFGIGRD